MSIEEVLALKEKIGSKVFDQSLGLAKPSSSRDKYKRENKNRPRMEPIAKRPVKKNPDNIDVKPENKRQVRDPRFDPLCGEFDDKVNSSLFPSLCFESFINVCSLLQIFKASYKFVDSIKAKELVELKKQLQEEEDPEKVSQIKYLIQRMVSVQLHRQ